MNNEMSEEKPTFKVTDRRLFNSDGSARDVERQDATIDASATITDVSGSSASMAASEASAEVAPPRVAAESSAPTTPFDDSGSDVIDDQFQNMSDDPLLGGIAGESQEFVNLVMFVASPAAAALGMTDHPGMSGRDIDLPLAKHCIDLLGTLRERTKGNLSPQELQLCEGLLAELRMQYVSLTTARSSSAGARGGVGGGGFTGSDITGGR